MKSYAALGSAGNLQWYIGTDFQILVHKYPFVLFWVPEYPFAGTFKKEKNPNNVTTWCSSDCKLSFCHFLYNKADWQVKSEKKKFW